MNTFLYCFKVWITALMLGTIIHALNSLIGFYSIGVEGIRVVSWVVLIVVFGGGLAAPSLLLFWLALIGLKHLQLHPNSIKIWMSLISIALCLFQYSIGWNIVGSKSLFFSLPYIIIALAGVWYYKLLTNPLLRA